jgi:hypothetical protein
MVKGNAQGRIGWWVRLIPAAAMAISVSVIANATDSSSTPSQVVQGDIRGFALRWFEKMRVGEIDRSQLSQEYSLHLTDDAIHEMSKFLKEYEYGASPLGAQVLLKRSSGDQTFYIIKIAFPRGDAASLMFGFNADGKITGINLMSMAGD